MTTSAAPEQARMVVARFLDGRTLKGTTHDFAPNRNEFHVYEEGNERTRAVPVSTGELKAVFFVRSYEGDDQREDRNDLVLAKQTQGRKLEVRFADGEVITGVTMGYSPAKPGFFLIPADPDGNNVRVYVLNQAVASVRWL
jgi:hypothetical protein